MSAGSKPTRGRSSNLLTYADGWSFNLLTDADGCCMLTYADKCAEVTDCLFKLLTDADVC
jgi:hypothetical protein